MAIKKRSSSQMTTAAVTVGLGAAYGMVLGYNVFSSADATVSLAIVDADGKTVATVASGDFTNTTGKDGVEKVLTSENAVTEDGTAATGNAGFGPGVFARSPLTVTPSGVASGYAVIDFYVLV